MSKKDSTKEENNFSPELAAQHVLEKDESEAPSRLLVIDDDESVRSLLKDLLEESGYDVKAASCGEEA